MGLLLTRTRTHTHTNNQDCSKSTSLLNGSDSASIGEKLLSALIDKPSAAKAADESDGHGWRAMLSVDAARFTELHRFITANHLHKLNSPESALPFEHIASQPAFVVMVAVSSYELRNIRNPLLTTQRV